MHQIFTSFNESYRVLAAACIASLFRNIDENIEIVVLDTGIKVSTRKKFERWAYQEKRRLTFIPISNDSYNESLGTHVEVPENFAYYPRILSPYYASLGAEKILYIDVDIICLQNPIKIFNINLNDNVIGSVIDPIVETIQNGIINYDHFGLEKEEPYFNSGVMLIDVIKWKSNNVSQCVLLTSNANKEYVSYADQYSLNILLSGKWLALSNNWNEIMECKKPHSIFRHFAGTKPTSPFFKAKDADLFFNYLSHSPYPSWWWKMLGVRLFLAKFHWKLKFYSNRFFNTKYYTETLNV